MPDSARRGWRPSPLAVERSAGLGYQSLQLIDAIGDDAVRDGRDWLKPVERYGIRDLKVAPGFDEPIDPSFVDRTELVPERFQIIDDGRYPEFPSTKASESVCDQIELSTFAIDLFRLMHTDCQCRGKRRWSGARPADASGDALDHQIGASPIGTSGMVVLVTSLGRRAV
ncbi:MAG: hypothetical protein AAF480_08640 [Actinomycetota bacterium]